jgi:hypothetical protein
MPWREAPVTTNWATPAQYAALGTQLTESTRGQPVQAGGEIGAIAYFCDCAIVDPFSDRALLIPTIDTVTAQAGPVGRWLISFNYHFLDRTTPPLRTAYTLTHAPEPSPGLPHWLSTSSWHAPTAAGPGYYSLTRTR